MTHYGVVSVFFFSLLFSFLICSFVVRSIFGWGEPRPLVYHLMQVLPFVPGKGEVSRGFVNGLKGEIQEHAFCAVSSPVCIAFTRLALSLTFHDSHDSLIMWLHEVRL